MEILENQILDWSFGSTTIKKLFKNSGLGGKTTNEIIDEIHESFYTEVDKLLAEANISHSIDTEQQRALEKQKRLEALGFGSTKHKKAAESVREMELMNEKKKELVDAINYFSAKYPQYKFITEHSVERICEKYGLVYGSVSRYIGEVPDENLKHIEEFKIDEEDECYMGVYRSMFGTNDNVKYYDKRMCDSYMERNGNFRVSAFDQMIIKCPLEIAAPLKDFEKSTVNGYRVEVDIPDPVVLKPVFFGGNKHYLIVTAWGQEASDDLVVNEKMN